MNSYKGDNKDDLDETKILSNLDENVRKIKEDLSYPVNEDVSIRELLLESLDKRCFVIFINVMVHTEMIQQKIIRPLVKDKYNEEIEAILKASTAKEIKMIDRYSEMIEHILMGNTILLVEEDDRAISIETAQLKHRNVDKPVAENVVKGPQEGFVESIEINIGLIRKQIRSKHLINETITIGKESRSKISLLYLKNIIDPKLVDDIKNRIYTLDVDTIQNIPILEQYIEERPYSIIPTTLYTERPDRAVAFLHEGHLILLMDSSSDCLILPTNFWSLFQTPEDSYLRWSGGNFIRVVRFIALLIALYTPALFIAITTFHVEMIPTDLVLAIAATRERVPFPLFFEVMLMEISFELLRESGIRIPTPMGPTIGIVGALILGQAAVEANLVSPILVIVVSITGLASFTISNISLSYAVRITKFIFLTLGGVIGIPGVAAGTTIMLGYLVSVKSFGVPFFAPIAPHFRSSKDIILRPPIQKQWIRPQYTGYLNPLRKKVGRRK